MPNLRLTTRTWPVVTLVTIGLCYLTQLVAGWFGIELPEQKNVDIVRQLAGWNWRFAFLVAQVVIILPTIEELIFRGLLFKLPLWAMRKWTEVTKGIRVVAFVAVVALVASALFSAAHYLAQPWPDNAFIALFFFGLAQCWLYRKTNHIWCPMMNHALFNVTNLILLFIIPEAA